MNEYTAGSTSLVEVVDLMDSASTNGAGKTGLAYNTASLTCYYKRSNGSASVPVTLVNITTLGTFVSGGFKEIDATNQPGSYEFHPPNAAFASGAKWVTFYFVGAAGMVRRAIKCRILAVDPDNGVNGGQTALPNVASGGGAGSLPVIGTGTNNFKSDGSANVTFANTTIGSVTGNVGGNVVGSVASVVAGVSIASGGIVAASFANNAITAAAIAADAIGASELAADAITEIQTGLAVPGSAMTLSAGAITTATFATGAIDAAAIAADAIGASELAASAIAEIQNGLMTTAGYTAPDNTGIAAIKTKTDNLPSDPADASDIAASFTTVNGKLDAIDDYIDTEIAALATAVADIPTNSELATALSGLSIPTADQNATAVWTLANGTETSITPQQALRLILAAAVGELAGAEGTTITIRDANDTKVRITATVTADGNRTQVVTDAT